MIQGFFLDEGALGSWGKSSTGPCGSRIRPWEVRGSVFRGGDDRALRFTCMVSLLRASGCRVHGFRVRALGVKGMALQGSVRRQVYA